MELLRVKQRPVIGCCDLAYEGIKCVKNVCSRIYRGREFSLMWCI